MVLIPADAEVCLRDKKKSLTTKKPSSYKKAFNFTRKTFSPIGPNLYVVFHCRCVPSVSNNREIKPENASHWLF
jgi:hypothetical protein